MSAACPLLAETDVFHYHYLDGFTERLLRANLLVDAAGYFRAELHYQSFKRGDFTRHTYRVEPEPLPASLFHQLTALLADPGFRALPATLASGWDDLGYAQLLGRTATGLHRIEVEEPYGRNLGKGATAPQPTTPTETALVAMRDACTALVQQLYARAIARP
ncbi:MAG: hypothetical protein ACRYFX_03615 [Janthinobacterium lividum]